MSETTQRTEKRIDKVIEKVILNPSNGIERKEEVLCLASGFGRWLSINHVGEFIGEEDFNEIMASEIKNAIEKVEKFKKECRKGWEGKSKKSFEETSEDFLDDCIYPEIEIPILLGIIANFMK